MAFRSVSLIILPTVIDKPGLYVTRINEVVEIESVGKNAYGARGRYSNGVYESWDISGRILPYSKTDNDIVRKYESKV